VSLAPPGQPDLSPLDSRIRAALDEIRAIVGSGHVIHEDDEVERHSRDTIPRVQRPVAFTYPKSVEEVTALVHLANQYELPIWPVSQGKNWGYGGATPARTGGIVMVLERLNRIIEINTEMAYAIVEPGVTYRQLHQHLQQNQIALWVDCTDGPADGSVMGNALERGIGETDYGDHFGNICGLEVVLPDGSIVRTGGGPVEGFKSWNTYKWGVGPYVEGLFSQGNYGIVTKMGLWLMPKPEYFASCVFELHREEDFPALIDAMRRLQLGGAIKSKVHLVNDVVTFAALAEPQEILGGEEFLSDARRTQLRRRFNVAPWSFAAGLYGTRDQVSANVALIRRELSSLGKLQLIDDRKIQLIERITKALRKGTLFAPTRALAERLSLAIFGRPVALLEVLPELHAIEKGYPSDHFVKHAYYKSRRRKPADGDIDPARDHCGLIWLGPMVPLNGRETLEVFNLVRPLYQKYKFDFTAAIIVGNPRTAVALMSVFYDKEDPDQTRRAEALYFEMGEVTQKAGYQQYRTSTMFMERILKPAPEFQALCSRIKTALDPRGILAPGKYGIDTLSAQLGAREGGPQ
jgi:4-cresol dehydrogenase (hydroxylating) flavoprotein subunit